MDRRFFYYLHRYKAIKKDGKEKRKVPVREILEIVALTLPITASISFAISLLVIYIWHKAWFENLDLPLDLSWVKSEFVVISLINIGYILFFLFIALIFIFSFYPLLRGFFKGDYFLWEDKRGANTYRFSLIFFISFLFHILNSNWIFIIFVMILITIPSICFHTYFDNIFNKIKRVDRDTYSWKSISIIFFMIIAIFLYSYLFGFQKIFLNPLIYVFLFVISIFSLQAPLLTKDFSAFKFWIAIISCVLILIVPIILLMEEATRDAKAVKKYAQSDNSYTYKPVLPLYGLLSSKSLQRGTVFIENIESVYGATYISKEECEQKVLKDRWFISFGEITFVFTSKDNLLNILILKDGKFLRAVQSKGD